ncbi:MAG: hypothetical protein KF744_06690 [Taibaiella sp.]|nr:hypothetical protein [Taibaiella sp.]
MKRIIATIVLVAYTAAAISFSFSVHYCGGSLQGVYLTAGHEAGCCDDEEEADGCCEDRVVSAKTNADHNFQTHDFVLKPVVSAAPLPLSWISHIPLLPRAYANIVSVIHGPAPPLICGVPLFVLHRNFRI